MTTHPFSANYIAMAKAAEEIQAMAPSRGPTMDIYVLEPHLEDAWDERSHPSAWIPRLDQLLGMLGEIRNSQDLNLLERYRPSKSQFYSGERPDWHEVALTIVMRDKYGKRWDGKGWVKA